MSKTILIVEDEAPKREHLLAFLSDGWPSAVLYTAKSVRSAISAIQTHNPDLLLLDMSLTTFDIGPDEPGGRPQGFGGIEVMRYLDLYSISLPIIVVTAYEAFTQGDGSRTLDHGALHSQLQEEHSGTYRGLVYYNSLFSDWRTDLSALIKREFGDS